MDNKDKKCAVELTVQDDQRSKDTAEFLRTTFKAKECAHFIQAQTSTFDEKKKKTTALCHCGGTEDEHRRSDKVRLNQSIPQAGWNESYIDAIPTNAFGRIRFFPTPEMCIKSAKYVRLADDSDMKNVLELIRRFFIVESSEKPELVISVVGGGKHFHITDRRKKEIFNLALINAVRATHGWILSFGTNAGVARAVGEAVKEGQIMEWYQDGSIKTTIHCIGIVPWGMIRGRNDLINKDPNKLSDARHRVHLHERLEKTYSRTLNPHHSHFILVDSGLRNRDTKTALFRAKLEQRISALEKDGGLGVPVICILIDGGAHSLHQLFESVKKGISVLVCEGTGRAADVLAFACRHYSTIKLIQDDAERSQRMQELRLQVCQNLSCIYRGKANREALYISMTNHVMELCREDKLVTVVQVDNVRDMELAILRLLNQLNQDQADVVTRLKWAIKFNWTDTASLEMIADSSCYVNHRELNRLFLRALIDDQVNVVRQLIEYGLSIHEHLTVAFLRELYNNTITETSHLWSLMRFPRQRMREYMACPELTLTDVHRLLRRLTRRYTNSLYEQDEEKSEEFKSKRFPKPFQELFIWAVLMYRTELALYFWEMCEDPLTVAIVGTILCEKLLNAVEVNRSQVRILEEVNPYGAFKDCLEQLAVDLVNYAYDLNRNTALLLIHRPASTWGNLTNIELSVIAKNKAFLSTPCCQSAIFKTWKCGLENNDSTIVFCAFTVFPICFLISFEDDVQSTSLPLGANEGVRPEKAALMFTTARSSPRNSAVKTGPNMVASTPGTLQYKRQAVHASQDLSKTSINEPQTAKCELGSKIIPGTNKILRFYRAPVVKFTIHTALYIVYLLLYAYVILFAFHPDPEWPELLLYVWQLAFVTEEIRQVLSYPGHSLGDKIADWWDFNSFATWSRVNCITMLASISAFCLRWFPPTFSAAFLLLVLGFILYCLRLFKVYFVNCYLGPKVVMIKKMSWDVLMFLLVLVVFMASYSIASLALMHRDRPFYWGIFWDVFGHAIWKIFGQLDEESMTGNLHECGSMRNSSDWNVDCIFLSWPVPVLLTLYLFFGSLLLVNLLIALFSNVVNEVQANAKQIWKYEIYALVTEFQLKPLLSAPFVLFYHLWLICCLWKRHKKAAAQQQQKSNVITICGHELTKREQALLSSFEEACRVHTLHRQRRSEAKQAESIVADLQECMNKLSEEIQSIKETIVRNSEFQGKFYQPSTGSFHKQLSTK